MNKKLKIIHLEDVSSDAVLINNHLKKCKLDCEILVVDTKDIFIKELNNFAPDIILADHYLPSFNSHEALLILNKAGLKIPFIVVTATMSDDFAADMIIRGADDYILKDRLSRLPAAINDALKKYRLQYEKQVIVDELIKSEYRLKQTQAIANIGSWELDDATGIAIWSDEQLKIYGLESENNRQSFQTWISFIHPEDLEFVLQKTNEAKATESNADYFHRIIRSDGTVRHLYSQIRVRVDGTGNPTGLHGVTRDVTEAKKRESALHESQLNLQAIFENTSDGFILADTNGIIKSFNNKARDRTLLNINREIAVGKSIFDFLPYSGKKINKDNILKVLSGKILQNDYAYTRKSGETKWFSFTINPVYNAEKIKGFSITSTDITERKKVEEQLKESELFSKNVLSSLVNQIAVINASGTIISVNKAWNDFSRENGATSLEHTSVGSNYLNVCNKAMANGDTIASEVLQGILAVFKKNVKTFELEYPCHSPTEQRWFNLSVMNFGEDDSKVVISHQNITDRKIAEQEKNSLQSTLQSSLNEIYIFDFDTLKFIYVNKGALLNLGYSEYEIKALMAFDLKPDFSASSFKKLIAPIVNNEKEKIIFFSHHKRKDGSIYPVEVHLQLVAEGNNKRFLGIVLDITERKIAEENLLASSERLLLATTSAKMGIWDWDIVNDTMTWDKRMYELYGIRKQHFTGAVSVWQNGVHPDDIVKADKEVNDAISGISDFHSEFRVVWPDKSIHFLEAHAIVSRDENGNAVRMIGGNIDVTERKKAEKEITDSEEKRRLIMSGALDAIICIDNNDCITFWNPQAEVIFGWKEAEVMGRELSNLIVPEPFRSYHTEGLKRYLETGVEKAVNVLLELKAIRQSGEEFPIELTVLPIKQGVEVFFCAFIRDITQRKKAEENNRFKANLLNTIGQAAVATDMNGIVSYWNNAAEQIYGWTQEEAIGKNIIDLTPSQATKEQTLQIMEELKQGHQWSGEFKLQRKDGTDFPAWVTDAPIYDEHQNLKGIIGISSDITPQKKLQELLDKTNKLARIGNYEVNVEDDTLYWSEVTREIHEVDKDFVPDVAKAMSFYKEGSSKDRINRAVKNLIKKNIPYDIEVQIVTAKGNNRWVRLIGQAEFIEGKCIKRYGSVQDIDERKMAEIEILKVYEEKNIILESIGDGFFAVDKNWVVNYWNNQAEKMLHIPKNKITGQYLWKIFAENNNSQSYKKYHEAIETKRVIRFEDYYNSLDKWFDISAYPSDNGLSVFFKDITQQKKFEEEREKITIDLVQRNKDLEQFSYIVSHNMRSPVADIIGLCDVLQKDNLSDVIKSKIISGLSSSVNMLDNVFKDLNNILKVRQGVIENKQEVCLSKLVNNILLSIESILDKEKATVLLDFSEVDEMFTIKSYLHSIFYNLIVNSLKYRQPNISPVIKIKSKKLKDKTILIFKDNGLGIDLQKRGDQVFGLYKRFHTDMADGKGIGLYMVKTQVESIGGKISISSKVNMGTSFKIEFET